MPHFFDTGFSVREASWHRLENLLEDWPETWEEAWKHATNGHPWDIDVEHSYRLNVRTASFLKTDSIFVVRDDNREILSTSGPDYHPITNAEYGEVIAQVMEANGVELRYETTVVLKGGRIIASTMFLPQDIEIPGDPSPMRLYYVFMTSHDKSVAFKFGKSHVRIWCWNTQQAAESELDASQQGFSIKHTANWKVRLAEVLAGMKALQGESEAFVEWAADLSSRVMTERKVAEFMDKWIPWSTDMSPKQMEFVMGRRQRFTQLLNESKTTEGIRGTQWGVYQAAVEACDHFTKSKSLDTEIKRQLLTGDDRKAAAVRILAKL